MNQTTPTFLRWAGGKRWIAPHLAPALKSIIRGRYLEPFLGAGSMFFTIAPQKAVLGDLNGDLIEVYREVALHARKLETQLKTMPVNRRSYYKVRASEATSAFDRAARFIYLNRTCFGGLHRTNRRGEFNVPYGGGSRTPAIVYRERLLQKCAKMLRQPEVTLVTGDFGPVVDAAESGDVVFCDPTYRAAGRDRFDRYGPEIFSWSDQERLAAKAASACKRGATVVVANADDDELEALYKGCLVLRLEKRKTIGNRTKLEERHRELLLILDPLQRASLWSDVESRLLSADFLSTNSTTHKSMGTFAGHP